MFISAYREKLDTFNIKGTIHYFDPSLSSLSIFNVPIQFELTPTQSIHTHAHELYADKLAIAPRVSVNDDVARTFSRFGKFMALINTEFS